jgi:hypothetical protein
MVLFVTIEKFDPNLVVINMNKFKTYRFIDDNTLQLVLTNPSDLTIKELIENEVFKLVPIERVTNHENVILVGSNVNFYSIEVCNPKGCTSIHNHNTFINHQNNIKKCHTF